MSTAGRSDGIGAPGDGEQSVVEVTVQRVGDDQSSRGPDLLAVEEPLEIRLVYGPAADRARRSISVTMRTPGRDVELAVGFLFAEGVVRGREDIDDAVSCGPPAGPLGVRNLVRVELAPDLLLDEKRLERNFLTTSSCGLCGKASLDTLPPVGRIRLPDGFVVSPSSIHQLPDRLRDAQTVFDRTGGLHAAALFDGSGRLLDVQEDVGRHNAVDKLIGAQLLAGALPLSNRLVLVSGRAGYELVQKALAASVPLLAAVGAPTSLAADLARDANMTLLGFVRERRFNVYSGGHRIGRGAERPSRWRGSRTQSTAGSYGPSGIPAVSPRKSGPRERC
jgi:FdhD protein